MEWRLQQTRFLASERRLPGRKRQRDLHAYTMMPTFLLSERAQRRRQRYRRSCAPGLVQRSKVDVTPRDWRRLARLSGVVGNEQWSRGFGLRTSAFVPLGSNTQDRRPKTNEQGTKTQDP